MGLDSPGAAAGQTSALLEGLGTLGIAHLVTDAWNFRSSHNIGSGATVQGIFGRSNVTLTNSPTWGTNGVTFNGTTQSGSATLPKTQTNCTLIAVFAGAGTQASNAAIAGLITAAGRATGGTGGHIGTILYNGANPIQAAAYNGSTAATLVAPSQMYYQVSDTNFRMYGLTNTSSGNMTMNVDGCLPSEFTTPATVASVASTNAADRVTIASSWSGAAAELFFSGTVAFVMVFNSVLTPVQIQSVYKLLRTTVCSGIPWQNTIYIDGDSQAAATTLGTAGDRWMNKLYLTTAQRWYGKVWQGAPAAGVGMPAASGNTSTQRVAAYAANCVGQKPLVPADKSTYVLCVGVNDIAAGISTDQSMTNINTLLANARRDGMRTVLMGLPDWANAATPVQYSRFKDLQARIRTLSGTVDLYVPLDTKYGRHNLGDFVDGVHLGALAQTYIADFIFAAFPTP